MKFLLLPFFTILLFLSPNSNQKSSLSSESKAAFNGEGFGYTNGQFSVTDAGSAAYGIPLSLSPGTAGMTPELTIAYNSMGGNGMMGNGMSLLGISSISRSGRTLAQDNEIRGIKLDDTDSYSLDGERLVLVNGEYGADGSEYRTEQNAFMKIVSYGNANGSPEKFLVRTNSGLILEYGYTGNSKVEVQESGKIVFWLVNKIQDTKGNYMLFNYEKDIENGDYRPVSIEYTGNINTGLAPYNTVEFFYEDRPDNIPRYIMGRKVQSNKILKSIKSFHENQLAREYRFEYKQGNYSGVTLLETITECGSDGSCLEPTTFIWKEENGLDFTTVSGLPSSYLDQDNIAVFQGDWDGNGLIDLLAYNTWNGANRFLVNSWNFQFTDLNSNPISPGDLDDGRVLPWDFNTDGQTDIMWYNPFNGANRWFTNKGINNGILSFQTSNNLINPGDLDLLNNENVSVFPTDWNGDGRTDVFIFHQSSGTNRFYLNNSENGENPTFTSLGASNFIPSNWISGGSALLSVDWNGDGLNDLLWYNENNGSTKWIANTGDGNNLSFASPVLNAIPANQLIGGDGIQLGDWNGDGLIDLMWHNMGSGGTKWFFNKGDLSFFEAASDLPNSTVSPYESLIVLDFNGDSFDDVVLYNEDSGGNRWLINDGRCQFLTTANVQNAIPPQLIQNGTSFNFGGYGGESIVDAFWYDKTNGNNCFFRSSLEVSNLVEEIVAGNGYSVTIDYRPLTEDDVYEKEKSAVFPNYDFQNKFFVVRSYSVDNGIGGTNKMSYQYKGAKMNLHGRGFRGFREIHVTDESTGIVNSKYLNRDYRYIGSPLERAETRLSDGTLISETINKDTLLFFYGSDNNPLKTHFAYTYESVSNSYEIDGSFVSSITTRNYLDDYGNIIKNIVDYGDGYIDSTYNTFEYSGFLSNWILGRLVRSEVTKFGPSQSPVTKVAAFEYDAESGLLIQEITEPDLPPENRIEKSYVHDGYGNIIQSTVSFINDGVPESRNTFSTYDNKGRFLISASNDLGHINSFEYHALFGHKISETDANGLSVTYQYDSFGRVIRMDFPDGTWRITSYQKCEGDCPPGAIFYLQSESTIDPPTKEYYDILGREIIMETIGFNGMPIYEITEYNELGLIARKSDPHFGPGQIFWTEIEYDAVGREIKVTEPGDLVSETIYDGFTTTQINPKGQSKTITKNNLGQIASSADNQGNSISYAYDLNGNMLNITDPQGNIISMTYDIYSNKTSMSDPNMGTYEYSYNPLGELLSQKYPKGNMVEFEYDILGRVIQKTEPEGGTTWVYDTQDNGIGKLANIVSSDFNYSFEILYDTLSRISRERETIEGQLYETLYYFDEYGRPLSTYYPLGLAIRYNFNEFNYFDEVRDISTNQVYWKANEFDAKGQLTQQIFGNNTTTNYTYNAATNWLENIKTISQVQGQIQNLNYSYDIIGNLTQRTDLIQGFSEKFSYDNLNRLTSAIIPFQDTVNVTYDALGNITSKSDVGQYFYGENGAGPQQLTRVEGNGTQPCIPSSIADFNYTSFNKVNQIIKDSFRVEIDYAPTYRRIQNKFYLNDTLVKKKIYVGSSLEIEITDTLTKSIHYIRGVNGVVAVRNMQSNGEMFTHYWHKDHLGSLQGVSNEEGQLVQVLSYDAWGKRRNPDGSSIEDENYFEYDRGFTGHEHLDWFALINMNGRIYDPVLGRFLSPDPFIQDDTDLQNLNRYVYVLNNPLSYNDPSGYFFKKLWGGVKKVGKGISQGFKKTVRVFNNGIKSIGSGIGQIAKGNFLKGIKNLSKGLFKVGGAGLGFVGANELGKEVFGQELWNTLVVAGASIAVGIVTGGTGTVGMAILSGAASGFTGGTLGTMLNGGSFSDALLAGVKGAVLGGVMAGATFGIGSLAEGAGKMFQSSTSFSQDVAHYGVKIVGHGAVQGGMSELQGGAFMHGFAVGAFTSISQPFINNIKSSFGRVISSAVTGGTVSVIGGGKFVNGAISGAFIRLYNDSMHEVWEKVKLHARFLSESFADSSGDVAVVLTGASMIPGPQQPFVAGAAGAVSGFNIAVSGMASALHASEGNAYQAWKYGSSAAIGGAGKFVARNPLFDSGDEFIMNATGTGNWLKDKIVDHYIE